jgi:peptide/nickel transport system permease protein
MLIRYIIKRLFVSIPVLLVISFSVFMVIQLPEGSFLDAKIEQMEKEGGRDDVQIENLRKQYHFDRPLTVQYVYWIGNFVRGNLGKSFEDGTPVIEKLKKLVPVTAAISLFTILLTWSIAVPFGIFAAVKKNTVWDYLLTFIGLAAMATPGFVIALVFQVMMKNWWPGFDPTGLVSESLKDLPWYSPAVIRDVATHLFVPVFILGIAGTAGMIRIMRANVIDELKKQYVLCARARGLHPALVVLRYPVRVAINPFMSNIGLILPRIISGSMIISIVLALPTLGPEVLKALMSQDTYLASSCVFVQCILAIIGILVSDVLLSVVDPRIKFEAK